jgi:hypothetical protein
MVRLIAASLLLAGTAALAEEPVPVYTNEDLERMFGPPPAPVSDPVDKSGPEDWGWVESYLDRQYARIDADRQYELQKRTLDIADERTYTGYRGGCHGGYGYYGGYAAFRANYPASVWYGNVSRMYRGGGSHGSNAGKSQPRPMPLPSPRTGGRK